MAIVVPLVVGALVSGAAWSASGALDGASASVSHARYKDLRTGVERLARRVGEMLPTTLATLPFVRACAGEAARVATPLLGAAIDSGPAATGVLAFGVAAGAVLGAVVALSPMGALAGGGIVAVVLGSRAHRRMRAQARSVEGAMPEAFHALSISIGSGHTLSQALMFVGNHATDPVRSEFMRASFAMTCGVAPAEALNELLRRLPAPGLDLVALALDVSRRTGAPLKDLLAQASEMVGERIELARRLEVKTAQARMSARLVAVMPLAMMVLLALVSPDFRAGLATPVGIVSVCAALALDAVAWTIIRKIMEVEL